MTTARLDELSKNYVNLADADKNAKAIFATDEFFAAKERMLAASDPKWKEDVYDDNGKWMDGWESRRKREHGYDYCIVKLIGPGVITAVDIYTRYFTGNYPPIASIDACELETVPDANTQWTEIVSPNPIIGDSHNIFEVDNMLAFTYIRLNIFPDGGVARFRVYGETS